MFGCFFVCCHDRMILNKNINGIKGPFAFINFKLGFMEQNMRKFHETFVTRTVYHIYIELPFSLFCS